MAFKQSFLQNEPNFQKGRMGVSIYMKGDYEEKQRFGFEKNKANSKPIAGLWPEIRNKTNGCGMTDIRAYLRGYV